VIKGGTLDPVSANALINGIVREEQSGNLFVLTPSIEIAIPFRRVLFTLLIHDRICSLTNYF